MPPLHPAIVHFPVALTVASVVADSAGLAWSSSALTATGGWTILMAGVGGVAAAAAGYRDMRRDTLNTRTHAIVHLHLRFGLLVVAAVIALAAWRWIDPPPGPLYLLFAWLALVLVLAQAWLGGELVYAHGAGVAAAGQGQAPASEAQIPSTWLYRRLMRVEPGAHGDHDHP